MPAIAVVGPDGAGKTTLCRLIEESNPRAYRYVYMGVNPASSNILLPTTRLLHFMKDKSSVRTIGEAKGRPRNGPVARCRAAVRIANQIVEEWYRQLRSWIYQLQGYVVLYDRHYLTDFTGEDVAPRNRSLGRRVHLWLLHRVFPRPDLIIFLDAPGDVLFARKRESTVEALEDRRRAHLRQLDLFEQTVRVDATRPLELVCEEVEELVSRFLPDSGIQGRTAVAVPKDRRSRSVVRPHRP